MAASGSSADFDKNPPLKVDDYDRSIRYFCGGYDEIFRLAHCCLSAGLAETARLLVVGAGTGQELTTFAAASPDWSLLGVDPSADMLAIAREKIAAAGLSGRVRLQQGYVDDLDDEPFDGATCILVMHLLADDAAKLILLKSIAKRLKTGSPLILVDGCGVPGSPEFGAALRAWQRYPLLHGVPAEIVEKAFNEVILQRVSFLPEEHILALLAEAGFTGMYRFYSAFLYGGWCTCKA